MLRTDHLVTQLAAARAGLGVALVPHPSIAHYGLVPLPFADPEGEARRSCPSQDLYLVTHRTLRRVPRVKVVWEALLASLQQPR